MPSPPRKNKKIEVAIFTDSSACRQLFLFELELFICTSICTGTSYVHNFSKNYEYDDKYQVLIALKERYDTSHIIY